MVIHRMTDRWLQPMTINLCMGSITIVHRKLTAMLIAICRLLTTKRLELSDVAFQLTAKSMAICNNSNGFYALRCGRDSGLVEQLDNGTMPHPFLLKSNMKCSIN